MRFDRRRFLQLAGVAATQRWLGSDLGWASPDTSPQRRGRARRVAILGAGLSGLVAAWTLRRAGHEAILLEAQLHPGGRVHTVREGLSDGLHAEAGAGRIPAAHQVTREWAAHFGLELEPFYPTRLAQIALVQGKRIRISPQGRVDAADQPAALSAQERQIGLTGLDEHYYGDVMKKLGASIRDDWSAELRDLGEISMGDFLRRRGASEQAIHYMLLGFEDDAALDFIRDANNHRQLSRIKGGNDLLPRAFASKLSDVIHYGCAVEHIARHADGVRIAYRRAGMLDQLDADACICTIPFSVLRGIAVTPEWSPAKRKVIDGTYYGPVERITYQVRRRYWEAQGLNGYGTSDKNFEVWHPTHGTPGARGLLQAYVYEDYAAELDRLSDSARTERAIADMDEVHPGLRDELETVVVKSWANDPWQKGAFIVYRAGDQKSYPDICRPDGRVWFAGEHTSAWPAWMQGALTSGIAAARAVDADGKA